MTRIRSRILLYARLSVRVRLAILLIALLYFQIFVLYRPSRAAAFINVSGEGERESIDALRLSLFICLPSLAPSLDALFTSPDRASAIRGRRRRRYLNISARHKHTRATPVKFPSRARTAVGCSREWWIFGDIHRVRYMCVCVYYWTRPSGEVCPFVATTAFSEELSMGTTRAFDAAMRRRCARLMRAESENKLKIRFRYCNVRLLSLFVRKACITTERLFVELYITSKLGRF